jgi:hypothetical protein
VFWSYGDDTNPSGGNDFTVADAQVYQILSNNTIGDAYNGSGTVKIGDLTVGSVTGGKLTYTLPAPVSSQYLTAISDIGFTVSPSNVKGILMEGTALLYSGSTRIGGLVLAKIEGSTIHGILYWYFDSAVKITGSSDGTTMSIDANAGWNKIYVYGTQTSGTYTTNLSNVPSDMKWTFQSLGN